MAMPSLWRYVATIIPLLLVNEALRLLGSQIIAGTTGPVAP